MRVLLAVMAMFALTLAGARAQQAESAPPAATPGAPEEAQPPPEDDPFDWDSTVPGATLPAEVRLRLEPRINSVRDRGRALVAAGAPTRAQTVAPGEVLLAVPVRHARGGVLANDLVQQGAFGGPS